MMRSKKRRKVLRKPLYERGHAPEKALKFSLAKLAACTLPSYANCWLQRELSPCQSLTRLVLAKDQVCSRMARIGIAVLRLYVVSLLCILQVVCPISRGFQNQFHPFMPIFIEHQGRVIL